MNPTAADISDSEPLELFGFRGQQVAKRRARSLRAPRGLAPWYALWALIFVSVVVFGSVSALGLVASDLPQTRVISATAVLLIPMTFLSYLPLIFFVSFVATERGRGRRNSVDAVSKMGWGYLEGDVVAWHNKAFSLERYPIPITIALLTFFGWWTFVFFHAGPVVIEDFAREQQMQRLMQSVETCPPVAFGFLGAYFFSVSFLFFRYMRADLGPGVYVNICVRTWTVTILVVVLTVVWRDVFNASETSISTGVLIGVSFLGGITPPVLMNLIKVVVRDKLKLVVNDDAAEMGLHLIDGLSPFKVARLSEEGIENLQNLAMDDPAKLVVVTQESGFVVLDWIDQALLRMYVPDSDDYAKYLKRGIRTSYDLFVAGGNAGMLSFSRGVWRVTTGSTQLEEGAAGVLASVMNHPNFHKIKRMREQSIRAQRAEAV